MDYELWAILKTESEKHHYIKLVVYGSEYPLRDSNVACKVASSPYEQLLWDIELSDCMIDELYTRFNVLR